MKSPPSSINCVLIHQAANLASENHRSYLVNLSFLHRYVPTFVVAQFIVLTKSSRPACHLCGVISKRNNAFDKIIQSSSPCVAQQFMASRTRFDPGACCVDVVRTSNKLLSYTRRG